MPRFRSLSTLMAIQRYLTASCLCQSNYKVWFWSNLFSCRCWFYADLLSLHYGDASKFMIWFLLFNALMHVNLFVLPYCVGSKKRDFCYAASTHPGLIHGISGYYWCRLHWLPSYWWGILHCNFVCFVYHMHFGGPILLHCVFWWTLARVVQKFGLSVESYLLCLCDAAGVSKGVFTYLLRKACPLTTLLLRQWLQAGITEATYCWGRFWILAWPYLKSVSSV